MTAWLLVIAAGLALGVLFEYVQRRVDDRAERERARASHRRLMGEIGRHP